MQTVVSLSPGPRRLDYEFETELWGTRLHVRRVSVPTATPRSRADGSARTTGRPTASPWVASPWSFPLGSPAKVAFASPAEAIALTPDDRFESCSPGEETDLDEVKAIYRLGLKHGLAPGAVRGARGPVTETEVRLVRERAEQRLRDQERPRPLETTGRGP